MFSYRRHCGTAWAAFQCVCLAFWWQILKWDWNVPTPQVPAVPARHGSWAQALAEEAESLSCRLVRGAKDKHWKTELGREGGEYPVCINRNGCWNRSLFCNVGEEQAEGNFPGTGWRCLGWKHNEAWRHTALCASPGVPGSCFSVNLDTKEGHRLGSLHGLKFTNHSGVWGDPEPVPEGEIFIRITEWSPW